jgi:hypothetical protein
MKRMNVTMNDAGDLSLLFTSHDSPSQGFTLKQSEVADLTPLESFRYLYSQLGLVFASELEIELDGDEDDEDISLYEDVIETPYSYLSDRGII